MGDRDGLEALRLMDDLLRKDGHQRAAAHKVEKISDTVDLQTDIQVYILGKKDILQSIPRLEAPGRQRKRKTGKVLYRDLTAHAFELSLPSDKTESARKQQMGLDAVVADGRLVSQRQVKLAVKQFLAELLLGGNQQVETDVRKLPVIIQYSPLEQRTEGISRSDAQGSDLESFHVPDAFRPGTRLLQHLRSERIELLAVIAQGDMSRITYKQLHSQLFFQFLDLLGNCALRYEKGL